MKLVETKKTRGKYSLHEMFEIIDELEGDGISKSHTALNHYITRATLDAWIIRFNKQLDEYDNWSAEFEDVKDRRMLKAQRIAKAFSDIGIA